MADLVAEHIAVVRSDSEGDEGAPLGAVRTLSGPSGKKKERPENARKRKDKHKPSRKADKRRRREEALSEALFGDAGGVGDEDRTVPAVSDATEASVEVEEEEEEGKEGEEEEEEEEEEHTTITTAAKKSSSKKKKKAPVWEDEDDKEVSVNVAEMARLRKLRRNEKETVISGEEYSRRLRETFERLNPDAGWASARRDEDADDEDDLLRSNAALSVARPTRLGRDHLEVTRVKDANELDRSQAVVRSVEFHPAGQVMLAAGLDKTLRLFQVDGVRNAKVQSVHLTDLPVMCARFCAGGSRIVAAGRRKYFYSVDVESGRASRVPGIRGRAEKSFERFEASPDGSLLAFVGRDGAVPLVSQRSLQAVGTLKMNGSVRACAFSGDGRTLRSVGGDGQVYLWDVRQRRCLGRHADEGAVSGVAVAVSRDGRYAATGSDGGVVNVYDTPGGGAEPVLRRAVMSLTTAADTVRFNHDAQILAVASSKKRDAMRLVHLPSGTVFSNFPTSSTPLRYVSALDFSPNGGFLAAGNDRGRVLLYRVHHYGGA